MRMKETVFVSACLLGLPCRYDGRSKPHQAIIALSEHFHLVPICPEQLGGLPTPRTPSEYNGKQVRMQDGRDVTAAFKRGAESVLSLARILHPIGCILQDRSPSCGVGARYDGSFTRTLTEGDGVTAEHLCTAGIAVIGAEEASRMTRDQLIRYFMSSER